MLSCIINNNIRYSSQYLASGFRVNPTIYLGLSTDIPLSVRRHQSATRDIPLSTKQHSSAHAKKHPSTRPGDVGRARLSSRETKHRYLLSTEKQRIHSLHVHIIQQ